jgi:hypothetical protein
MRVARTYKLPKSLKMFLSGVVEENEKRNWRSIFNDINLLRWMLRAEWEMLQLVCREQIEIDSSKWVKKLFLLEVNQMVIRNFISFCR